jgi:DNA-directed RNA polymerase subunit RPC12/RpoP
MPSALPRETIIALRARREAHRIASDILNKPIDPKSLACPRCARQLPLSEFDRSDDTRVDCRCGALVKLPPHLACYLPAYASFICIACGKELDAARISPYGRFTCRRCGVHTTVPREVQPYAPAGDDDEYNDFVLPSFPPPPMPSATQMREYVLLAVAFAAILLLVYFLTPT